jgi:hypothetical protein
VREVFLACGRRLQSSARAQPVWCSSHLPGAHGIASVVLEHRSRACVQARVRAGVLEQGSVDLLRQMRVSERMDREGGSTMAWNCDSRAGVIALR